jgi:peptide/nickel transport system substrate-binding protein
VRATIDVDAIVKRVMRGHAVAASVIMPPPIQGYDARLDGRLLPYDAAAAKRLLGEAGYPDGFDMGMDCPNDRYVNDEEICVAVVSMLAKVGIKANLTAQTKAKHFPKVQGGQSDFWMLGWAGTPTLDADLFMNSIMVCPDNVKGAFNPGRYCNKRVDELQARSANELDPRKRQELIYEAFKIHKEEIGHYPLHIQTNLWGMKKNITVNVPANGIYEFRFTRID